MTWQEALDYVAGMNAGTYANYGYTDWLLPNRKELSSLIDYSQSSPALPSGHPFTNVQSDSYWSSTSFAFDGSVAWRLIIDSGYILDFFKTSIYNIWPVRLRTSDISVSPVSYDFGNVTVGNTSTTQSFTVSNNGDADLVVSTISLTGTNATEFTLQNDLCSGQTRRSFRQLYC